MSTVHTVHQESLDRETLINRIKALGPWHMNIQVLDDLNTADVFTETGVKRVRKDGGFDGDVSIIRTRDRFLRQIDSIYPNGLTGKTFLDCACNAGGYSFSARERDVKQIYGFDVREHWIKQARFVKAHRKVGPTDRIRFRVHNLYELPEQKLEPFNVSMFKGIFYHLPDPISGLKIAADLTREVMFFNTLTAWDAEDGSIKAGWESTQNLMSGVHGLKWYPTGPKVCADILKWLGFKEIKLIFHTQQHDTPDFGRVEIIASKLPGLLDDVNGQWLR